MNNIDPITGRRPAGEIAALRALELAEEAEQLKKAGTALMQAAVLKMNKPEAGTMAMRGDGRFRSVDASLIAAIREFGKLLGISLGEESKAEALDRKAKNHKQRIEVVPHDPEGPKSKEDKRGCERSDSYRPQSGSGISG